MSLSFYLDHHVPAAIAAGLRQLQINVLTVAEDGRAGWEDDRLLERALAVQRRSEARRDRDAGKQARWFQPSRA